MRLKMFAGLLLLGKILSGCGSTDTIDSVDVNNDKIYQSYSVSYAEGSKYLKLRAQFRVGGSTGTTVRLVTPSTVTANGTAMVYHDGSESVIDTTGSFYKLSAVAAPTVENYTFTWTKSEGEIFTNILELPKPIGIKSPEADSSHSLKEDLTISFSGDPLKPNEQALVVISDQSSSDGESIQKTAKGSASVLFTPEDLKVLAAGPAKISVTRWISGNLESCNPDVGGTKYSSWTAKDVSILITE